jgi:hypothetical protein
VADNTQHPNLLGSELTGLQKVSKACADVAGWDWCDEHKRPRYGGSEPCMNLHPRYDDVGSWDEEMYLNEHREMMAAHYALPWWRRWFHRV